MAQSYKMEPLAEGPRRGAQGGLTKCDFCNRIET